MVSQWDGIIVNCEMQTRSCRNCVERDKDMEEAEKNCISRAINLIHLFYDRAAALPDDDDDSSGDENLEDLNDDLNDEEGSTDEEIDPENYDLD